MMISDKVSLGFLASVAVLVPLPAWAVTTDREAFIDGLDMETCMERPADLYLDANRHHYDPAHALSLSWVALLTLDRYEDAVAQTASWGIGDVEYIEDYFLGFRAMVAETDDIILVTFRHSDNVVNWLYNAANQVHPFSQSFALGESVHAGFGGLFVSRWDELLESVSDRATSGKAIWVFGHSLGGSFAQLAAAGFESEGLHVDQVHLSGSPKVGTQEWARSANALLEGRVFRTVNQRDPVARTPLYLDSLDEFGDVVTFVPEAVQEFLASFQSELTFTAIGPVFEYGQQGHARRVAWEDDAAEEALYWTELSEELTVANQSGTNPLGSALAMGSVLFGYLMDHFVNHQLGYTCTFAAALLDERG